MPESESDPNAAQIAYWNGPGGDRWAAMWSMLDRAEAAITRAVLELAAPCAGERVLDIGCGAGSTTLVLRERVGAGGAVAGIDISAPMLAVARERARAAAIDVTFVEADASTYAFRPEHDLVFSRFGMMFFADPVRAFANLRRAAAPGGRLAFVCWRPIGDNPWVTVPLAAAADLLPRSEPPAPDAPGPFGLADRDRLHGILDGAGWREAEIVRHDHAMLLGASVEEAARAALRIGPLARIAAELDDAARGRIRERLTGALAAFGTPDGVALTGSCWLVSARA